MYKDQLAGSVNVQGVECYFPPKPPLANFVNFGLPKKEQRWSRTELPTFSAKDIEIWDGEEYDADFVFDWEMAVRQETIKRTGCDPLNVDKQGKPKKVQGVVADEEYSMEVLDAFRQQELDRVFNGVWILINGKQRYLTGNHYFYLNWFFIDGKYPLYRSTDLEFFYVVEVVRQTDCPDLGVYYITRRGSGKSYKAGAVAYHTGIQKKYGHCGIQSKTDGDAETFFKTKILQPMTKMPEFLIPVHPHVGDITQIKKLEFAPPAQKQLNARMYAKMKREALYTFIDFRNAGEGAYDSCTLACAVQDEIAKLDPKKIANAEKRLQTVLFCVLRGVEKKGFIVATSTVEAEMSGGKEAKKIWDDSNPGVRSRNGRTKSGLVRLFCSALQDSYFDEYGESLVEKAAEYHQAEIDKLAGDPAAIVSYKQKNPRTSEEAFWFGGAKCIYNSEILFAAKDRVLNGGKSLTRRGDLKWLEKDKKAQWVDNEVNGRWWVSMFPDSQNEVKINSDRTVTTFTPLNGHKMVMGFDPYSAKDLADEDSGSNGAASVYFKNDYNVPEDYCNTIIADYLARPSDPFDCYEDIIIAAFFFSCPVLIEKNKSNALDYFRQRGYMWGMSSNPDDFILERPESTFTQNNQKPSDGLYSGTGIIEHYTNSTDKHIIDHGWKLKHINVINDWIQFDPKKTRRFDSGVAASIAVVAAEKKVGERKKAIDLSGMFKTWDNTGTHSSLN
jgi:hypothetical protein